VWKKRPEARLGRQVSKDKTKLLPIKIRIQGFPPEYPGEKG
jgi:hypothetical protein